MPPSPCYGGCTTEMNKVVNGFEKSGLPTFSSAVYSGGCYFLSDSYDPKHVHSAVVMFDENSRAPYFSTIFSFFGDPHEFDTWTLEQARAEMSPAWKESGIIKTGSEAARVEVLDNDGAPAFVYWMRQDSITKDIYYITYMGGGYLHAFCHLKPNPL